MNLEHVTVQITEYGKAMSDDDTEKLLKTADADGSGTLNYEEFIAAVFVQNS